MKTLPYIYLFIIDMKIKFTERKTIRLKNYDYSQNGFYFVTVCAYKRQNLFGKITNNKITLSEIGKEIEKSILFINNIYNSINIEQFAIMPNHMHMLINLYGRDRLPRLSGKSELSDNEQTIFRAKVVAAFVL